MTDSPIFTDGCPASQMSVRLQNQIENGTAKCSRCGKTLKKGELWHYENYGGITERDKKKRESTLTNTVFYKGIFRWERLEDDGKWQKHKRGGTQ